MISISTAWNSSIDNVNGNLIVDQIKEIGVRNIELGFSLSAKTVDEIINRQKSGEIVITSVHNFCPVPEGFDLSTFTPDFYSLSSDQSEQRKKAVDLTKESINTASFVQAKALVLHSGRVEMPQRTKTLIELYERGLKGQPEFEKYFSSMREERANKSPVFLKSIINSLEELLPFAKKRGVNICLENRFYYREIPSLTEFEEIFDYFSGADNLFYWHDCGHAQVAGNLGFAKHSEYLERYGNKMLGIHLHDVTGAKDHQAPGLGNLNFSVLKPYLNGDIIQVIEVHQPTTSRQIKEGIEHLREIGIV
ncbi:MAG: TIM barrel protein [Candidatus Omnitrophota bacterium]